MTYSAKHVHHCKPDPCLYSHFRFLERCCARCVTALSQAQFAQLLGVSVRTLQEWEQGRRQPSGAAQSHPEVLRELVAT